MEEYNITEMKEIAQRRGGRQNKYFSLNKSGYFRINYRFVQEHNLGDMKYAKIRAIKKENLLVVAINFLEAQEDGSFMLSSREGGSFNFSGRSIFAEFDIDYKSVVKDVSMKLNPKIQEVEGVKYFIIEIPVEEKNEF